MNDDYYLIDGVEYKWPDPPSNQEPIDDEGVLHDVDSGSWLLL